MAPASRCRCRSRTMSTSSGSWRMRWKCCRLDEARLQSRSSTQGECKSLLSAEFPLTSARFTIQRRFVFGAAASSRPLRFGAKVEVHRRCELKSRRIRWSPVSNIQDLDVSKLLDGISNFSEERSCITNVFGDCKVIALPIPCLLAKIFRGVFTHEKKILQLMAESESRLRTSLSLVPFLVVLLILNLFLAGTVIGRLIVGLSSGFGTKGRFLVGTTRAAHSPCDRQSIQPALRRLSHFSASTGFARNRRARLSIAYRRFRTCTHCLGSRLSARRREHIRRELPSDFCARYSRSECTSPPTRIPVHSVRRRASRQTSAVHLRPAARAHTEPIHASSLISSLIETARSLHTEVVGAKALEEYFELVRETDGSGQNT